MAFRDHEKGGNRIVKLKQMRAASVGNCCEYINISKGMRKDLSDPSVKVLSDESTYKVCFLMPRNMELLDEEDFQTKQYHYTTLPTYSTISYYYLMSDARTTS
jgi:hypothetical protein